MTSAQSLKLNRRQFIFGAIATATTLSLPRPATAARRQKITVRSSEEFFAAIGNNRRIELASGVYDLSAVSSELTSPHIRFEDVFDGREAVIQGVENLEIVGQRDRSAKILVRPQYADVLHFENSRHITIKSIEAGHWPDVGYCNGSVLQFVDCAEIEIERSVLFGSGTYGVWALRSRDLSCVNTTIQDCTYGIIWITECENFEFEDCQFTNNREYDAIEIARSRTITFDDCQFINNVVAEEWDSFFNVEDSEQIRVEDCYFAHNQGQRFLNRPGALSMDDLTFKDNQFTDI